MPSLKEYNKCPKCKLDLESIFGYAGLDGGRNIVTCPECKEKYVVYRVNGEFYWKLLPDYLK